MNKKMAILVLVIIIIAILAGSWFLLVVIPGISIGR